MKQKFRDTKLNARNLAHLQRVNDIIDDYQNQGYKMTLRQLYYQLVSRNVIANDQKEYKKLSRILTEGRMAGLVDWDAIEDRLRRPSSPYAVSGISGALQDTVDQYRLQRQSDQPTHIEVWVEKDAISNVLKRVTQKYGIKILVNRGYGSVTAIKDAYDRFSWRMEYRDQKVLILYLGDHDPSGLDMIRDIDSRVREMLEDDNFEIRPIALTMGQIKQYDPPPNPAKMTDTRSPKYIEIYGKVSWEVDALPPEVLHRLLDDNIQSNMDMDKYNKIISQERSDKNKIQKIIDDNNDFD